MVSRLRALDPAVAVRVFALGDGELLARVAELGAEVERVALPLRLSAIGDSGAIRGGRTAAIVRLTALAAALPQLVAFACRLRRAVAAWGPDVVHSNGLKCHVLAPLVARGEARVAWHLHDFIGTRPLMRRFLRWSARGADVAIAVSSAVADDARRVLPKYLPVCVLRNSVDLDRFRPGPSEARALDQLAGVSDIPPGTLRVGLVATYADWKGQDVFIAAAARLAATLSRPLLYYVVGGPIYGTVGSQFTRDGLVELARRAGVLAVVRFVEHQPDTAFVYRALDVVVHASTRPEPFGLAIAEAMASGRAVVVTRGGGAAEWGEHGVDHHACDSRDAAALAEAIATVVRDDAYRAALATQARRTAVARLGGESLGASLVAIYQGELPG